ncbi:DNA polymerase I [Lyngbya confervoides]|uniref:DNA polymerase I n=1 Tax=Lyngbya confervoides BDU141951 TaxID=1574623 RepID=A0ABD4SYN2_9CYAN|nr:DNA polymerase I [Lyngbya confervoides]MCM1981266.1 DNA polymerase I [Lyngbya confervoides BDU141951]
MHSVKSVPSAKLDPSGASPTLLLVDGHSLAFRSYYAFAKGQEGGLRTSTGIPTSVSYGFLKSFLEAVEQTQPDYLAIAFDLGGPTYRHEADPDYKAGRAETPEDFIPDLENLQDILAALNLKTVIVPGYEADDVIGTLTRRAQQQHWQVKILSGDRDLFQLVDQEGLVTVLYLSSAYGRPSRKAVAHEMGPVEVEAKIGVRPDQIVDYKALCGDSSDNIPGIKGVGHKTAVQLLAQFDTLAGIYQSLDHIKGSLQKKLIAGQEAALHSQFLAQIHLDVPIPAALEDFALCGINRETLVPLLHKLEFQSLLDQIHTLDQSLASPDNSDPEEDWFFTAADTEAAQQDTLQPLLVQTEDQLTHLVKILQEQRDPTRPVAWDTETTSLSPRDAALVGIGCCWDASPEAVAYIPVGHQSGSQLALDTVLSALDPILSDAQYPKVFQNAKYDRQVLKFQGIQLRGIVFDTLLASYVINPEQPHNLSDLSSRYLGLRAQKYAETVPKGQTLADLSIAAGAQYCALDAYATYGLVPALRAELDQIPALRSLFAEVELPLEPVLADMETWGIRIDRDYLVHLSQQIEADLERIETQAHTAAGVSFNLGSPKQLSTLLFDTLGLDSKKSRKTKLGYSTDAATLEKLRGDHPMIDLLLEYRTLAKLKSTYVDALPALIRPDTQRVHTDFNQAVTATGRLSSSNPNLQNIPIRTEFSRQIRAAFIPQDGWILASADYSQIELRLLAHLSQEPRLIEAFQTGKDIHQLTAQLLLDTEAITPDQRRIGKIINFGVIYGMGARRFAREADVSYREAQGFIERFYARYPGIFQYLKRMEAQAVSQGYVETLLGRRRYFEFDSRALKDLRHLPLEDLLSLDLSSLKMSNYDRAQLRAAANAPIQGSSADLIKKAMVTLHPQINPDLAHLLIQVHDELIFELDPDHQDTLLPLIRSTLEQAMPLQVPLVVEMHTGQNWMEAK